MVNLWLIMVNHWNNNISAWWFGTWILYFSCHIWDVILRAVHRHVYAENRGKLGLFQGVSILDEPDRHWADMWHGREPSLRDLHSGAGAWWWAPPPLRSGHVATGVPKLEAPPMAAVHDRFPTDPIPVGGNHMPRQHRRYRLSRAPTISTLGCP